MRNTINALLEQYRNLLLYGIIGILASSMDFCIYSLMVMMNSDLFVANALGVNAGIIISFTLNRRYNFKVKNHTKLRFALFYMIGMTGLAISTGILYVAVDMLLMNEFYAKLLAIVIVALIQFLLNKFVTFRT